jgi:hypothetical protein
VLSSCGLQDAFWALCATVENCNQQVQQMAIDSVEQTLPIWQMVHFSDARILEAVQAARNYASEIITKDQLDKATSHAFAALESAKHYYNQATLPGVNNRELEFASAACSIAEAGCGITSYIFEPSERSVAVGLILNLCSDVKSVDPLFEIKLKEIFLKHLE